MATDHVTTPAALYMRENRPGKPAAPGQHGADDAEAGHKSGDENRARPVTLEETIELGHALCRQPKRFAVPLDQPAAAPPSYEEAEVIPGQAAANRREYNERERQPARMRQDGPREKHGLARDGNPGAFEQNPGGHGAVSILRKEIEKPGWHRLRYLE